MLLLNLLCLGVLIALLIAGGTMVANRPSQELPVWFHVPLCQNVEHATCPKGPLQPVGTFGSNDAANAADAAGGCCWAVTPPTKYTDAQTRVVGGSPPYPAVNLASTWFDESEFVSGVPGFTDYTGSKASLTSTLQPKRAFTGQCVREDPNAASTPRDRSAGGTGAGSSYSFVVPTQLMVEGFRYMPKILRFGRARALGRRDRRLQMPGRGSPRTRARPPTKRPGCAAAGASTTRPPTSDPAYARRTPTRSSPGRGSRCRVPTPRPLAAAAGAGTS